MRPARPCVITHYTPGSITVSETSKYRNKLGGRPSQSLGSSRCEPRKNENSRRAVSDNHVLMYHRINLAAIARHSNVCSVIVLVRSTFSAYVCARSAKISPRLWTGRDIPAHSQPNYSTQLFQHPTATLAFARLFLHVWCFVKFYI